MYKKFLEGYDVVYGVRKKRDGESWFKLFTAKLFYLLLKKIAHVEIPLNTGDFRMISKRVKLALSSMKEKHRLIRGMISWVGFRQTAVEYNREARFGGETKYPLHKMLKLSLDGITSFSTVPLKIVSFSGVLISGCGLLYALYVIIQKLTGQPYVQGWSSIIVIILVIGGIQLIAFGILGEYIGRIFEESKNRPLYLIDEVYENDE
jgi:dolichol-phosphate mannosyltransferase